MGIEFLSISTGELDWGLDRDVVVVVVFFSRLGNITDGNDLWNCGNVVKTMPYVYHPPVITIFIGAMCTIPSPGWVMALF
jgi:hypothetical protein